MNLSTIGFLTLAYFLIYTTVFWLLLFIEKRNEIFKDPIPKKYPLISIIIPVYKGNKKEEIKKAVKSCIQTDYPKKEIVIAWNGPKNEVFEYCKKLNAKLVYTPKKGKAAGINEALKHIKGELFCCLDADSFLRKDTLKHMVGYFNDKKVGAVTSSMKVYKPKNLLQKFQWLEYIITLYLRKLLSLLDAIYVIPGPGGMFRTKVIQKLGGFDENNLAEDAEIALRLQANGYKIKNSVNAFVDTIAPDNIKSLLKQRIRWYSGVLSNILRYKEFILNSEKGVLGLFVIPLAFAWIAITLTSITLVMLNFSKIAWSGYKVFSVLKFSSLQLIPIYLKTIIGSIHPNFATGFMVLLLILSFVLVSVSFHTAKEKHKPHRYLNYIAYLVVYSMLHGIFWLFSVSYLLISKKIKLIKW